MKLLVVEDNPDLVANLTEFLEGGGHTVDIAYNGYTALGFALENEYDAIVLDLMLPGIDGLEVCNNLRAANRRTPIIMLTARDSLEDKLDGFASGADDYLIKPFSMLELQARLQALLRRNPHGETRGERLKVGDLVLDTASWQVSRAGRTLDLPPIPLKLLHLLMERSPKVVSRRELERSIWGDSPPDSDALRSHLHQLRSIIDRPFPQPLLHTVRGFGYRLASEQ